MRTGRLLKLATFLEILPREKFNFNCVIKRKPGKECGSVGCAIGWTPEVFPRLVKWNDPKLNMAGYKELATELFDICYDNATYLFAPGDPCVGQLPVTATPKMVAKHIRKFVKDNKEK